MSSDEEEALLLLALAEDETRKKTWVHAINKVREQYGEYHTLMPHLRMDEQRFYIYFRMTPACFDELLGLISDEIEKKDTNYRKCICSEERLAITLRYLATGDTFKTIGHSYRIGFTTVSAIVKYVSQAIIRILQPLYMPEPTMDIWKEAETGFNDRWQFPNCIGSIDGKHVTVKCPANSGSTYFCYKSKFSIVLLSIVGPDYKFICVDIGGYGKNSDGGIFEESVMGKKIKRNEFNIPNDKPLPGGSLPTPHCLIGDEAFSLSSFLMKPFPQRQARRDRRKRKYNYRLCRARGVVENTFGILSQKWRIYSRPMEVSVETAKCLVMATCVLHNYLREKNSDVNYFHCLEEEASDTHVGGAFVNFNRVFKSGPRFAMIVRERFVDFFNKNTN